MTRALSTFLALMLAAAIAHATTTPDGGMPDSDAGVADAGLADAGVGVDDGGTKAVPETTTSIASLPAAEPLSFKSALEKDKVTIGEPFHLTIEVRHAANEHYSLPLDLHMKDFDIRSHVREEHGTDPKVTLFRLTLQAFNVGDISIPALHLLAQTPKGKEQLEIPPQKITVVGVIDPSQGQPQMREDTRPLPTRYRFIWWPLVVLLSGLGGFGLTWYLLKRSKRPAPAPPPKPRLAPYPEAISRLLALEQEGLILAGKQQVYYFRLTEIVRDYLGRMYSFDALELTSDELLQELRKRSTPGLNYDGLSAFLRESDLVKFAKSEPTDGECKVAMDQARAFVEQIRPRLGPDELGRTA